MSSDADIITTEYPILKNPDRKVRTSKATGSSHEKKINFNVSQLTCNEPKYFSRGLYPDCVISLSITAQDKGLSTPYKYKKIQSSICTIIYENDQENWMLSTFP